MPSICFREDIIISAFLAAVYLRSITPLYPSTLPSNAPAGTWPVFPGPVGVVWMIGQKASPGVFCMLHFWVYSSFFLQSFSSNSCFVCVYVGSDIAYTLEFGDTREFWVLISCRYSPPSCVCTVLGYSFFPYCAMLPLPRAFPPSHISVICLLTSLELVRDSPLWLVYDACLL